MAVKQGWDANVYVTSSPSIQMASFETLNDSGDGLLFVTQEANRAHRFWDDLSPITVKVDGAVVTSGFTVEYPEGRVRFSSSQSGKTVTVQAYYYPYARLAQNVKADWKPEVELVNINDIGGAAWQRIVPVSRKASLSLDRFYADASFAQLLGGRLGIVLHASGTYGDDYTGGGPRWSMYARIKASGLSLEQPLLKEALELEVDGQAYYTES